MPKKSTKTRKTKHKTRKNGETFWAERLLARRDGITEYLVKWKGFGPECNTWERLDDLLFDDKLVLEKILDRRDDITEYLVKWWGYGHKHNTWESREHLLEDNPSIDAMIRAFDAKHPKPIDCDTKPDVKCDVMDRDSDETEVDTDYIKVEGEGCVSDEEMTARKSFANNTGMCAQDVLPVPIFAIKQEFCEKPVYLKMCESVDRKDMDADATNNTSVSSDFVYGNGMCIRSATCLYTDEDSDCASDSLPVTGTVGTATTTTTTLDTCDKPNDDLNDTNIGDMDSVDSVDITSKGTSSDDLSPEGHFKLYERRVSQDLPVKVMSTSPDKCGKPIDIKDFYVTKVIDGIKWYFCGGCDCVTVVEEYMVSHIGLHFRSMPHVSDKVSDESVPEVADNELCHKMSSDSELIPKLESKASQKCFKTDPKLNHKKTFCDRNKGSVNTTPVFSETVDTVDETDCKSGDKTAEEVDKVLPQNLDSCPQPSDSGQQTGDQVSGDNDYTYKVSEVKKSRDPKSDNTLKLVIKRTKRSETNDKTSDESDSEMSGKSSGDESDTNSSDTTDEDKEDVVVERDLVSDFKGKGVLSYSRRAFHESMKQLERFRQMRPDFEVKIVDKSHEYVCKKCVFSTNAMSYLSTHLRLKCYQLNV